MLFSVVFSFSVLFLNCVYTEEIGEACTIRNTGGPGICKLARNCPFVTEQANNGLDSQLCGLYMRTIPVFCCPVNNNIEPNENSLLFLEQGLTFENESPNSPQGYTSISERKCLEYSKPLTVTIQAAPLITDPVNHITSINVANCTNDGIPLITGGTVAEAGEFPFMAAIGYNGDEGIEWKCGGTLISEYFVLTAAHCCYTKDAGEPVKVRFGDLDLEKNPKEIQYYEYNIVQIIQHEGYHPPKKYNDIALLRVAPKVTFSDYVRPACLWTKSRIDQNKTIATGLGRTGFSGAVSQKLLKVSLFVYNNNQCSKSYKSDLKQLPNGIQSTMLCAGDLRGGKDTCQGDSGGPLLTTKKENSCLFYVVGVTSFGKACGIVNTPAVYTRVSEYVSWIERLVW